MRSGWQVLGIIPLSHNNPEVGGPGLVNSPTPQDHGGTQASYSTFSVTPLSFPLLYGVTWLAMRNLL